MKKVQPNAEYDRLTMVGHSMGGDITMYFAKQYPDEIKKVVTLDNLRVPFLTEGKFKILSFRSQDPQFKADPGVIPDPEQCEKAGITVVDTDFRHNDMRDTGPDAAKTSIQSMLDKFLDKTDSDVAPVEYQERAENPRSGPGLALCAGEEIHEGPDRERNLRRRRTERLPGASRPA